MASDLRKTGWRWVAALALAFATILFPVRVAADDIAATSRSVVRVVTIAIVDQEVVGFGHGSGFAVGPNRIVTNAHVVALAQQYPDNVVIGVVPSEGSKSYQGRVIAIDSKRDLALIEIVGAKIPPATLYGGSLDDSTGLVSLGYPGNVDIASAQSAADYIKPLAPVRSEGSLSATRTVNGVSVLLHTASISRGNSGGPVLDRCGRVLGVNSAITKGQEGDANFAFAISEAELAAFLNQAKQPFAAVTNPCMTLEARLSADQAADRAAAEAADATRRDAAAKTQLAREQAAEQARIDAQRSTENVIAIAALMLVLGALAVGGGGMLYQRDKQREAVWAASAGGVLMLAAIIVFVLRPGDKPIPAKGGYEVPVANLSPTPAILPLGKMVCKFVPDRSRLTVSSGSDVSLDWGQDGCMNERTQYADDNGKWVRVLVPGDEQTVSVVEFDPKTRAYTNYRYFLSADQMDAARKIRSQIPLKQCSADAQARTQLGTQQQSIRAALPPSYSEKLVYSCAPAN
ncbi:trypsin-like peptidase domain-containing protein [Sphingomonas panacisoli]|uniref:Trypsin-like peptidase domain-containing protein n=1 Tax=Sphingomonas panacisoli TaxID=1813879 RepID=A0A5B8LLA3_9SPHN|nr:serine protease [Sphingomonas panacisoli]QDZ08354.1 trypsin-like peptidase domain-containing protein [Sphingomonas panacisoli]